MGRGEKTRDQTTDDGGQTTKREKDQKLEGGIRRRWGAPERGAPKRGREGAPGREKLWGRPCKYAFHFLLTNLAYWAVRELGIPGSEVDKRLGLSQSAISRAVQRGEQ